MKVLPEELIVSKRRKRRAVRVHPTESNDEWAHALAKFVQRRALIEKLRLVVDRVQTFGVIWECSQAWPWPTIWLEWSRWAIYANIDVPGRNAGMGSTRLRPYGHSAGFLERVALPVVIASFVFMRWPRLACLLHIPCGLVVARLFQCEEGTLSADPGVRCDDASLARWTLGPLGLLFVVLLPRVMAMRADDAREFDGAADHEKAMQCAELEHVLDIDSGGPSDYDDLVASYRRHAVHHDAKLLVRNCGLLFCFGALSNARRTQGLAILFFVACSGVPDIVKPPYRSPSSNACLVVTEIGALCTASYAMLTAWGLRSSIVMPKQQSLTLIAVNSVVSLAFIVIALSRYKEWPAVARALRRDDSSQLESWIHAATDARAAALECHAHRPRECAPVHLVEDHMRIVRAHWLDAKRKHSLLEITLRKTLDELVLAHDALAPHALHVNTTWLPHLDSFDDDARYVATRHQARALMDPVKRRILLKLLALRHFQLAAKPGHSRRATCAQDGHIQFRPPLLPDDKTATPPKDEELAVQWDSHDDAAACPAAASGEWLADDDDDIRSPQYRSLHYVRNADCAGAPHRLDLVHPSRS